MNDYQPQGGREPGLKGMVNTREPLLNVVNIDKPKGLNRRQTDGLEPKGQWPGRGAITSPLTDSEPPAKRRDLNLSGLQAERGKPDVLPRGKVSRKASRWDGGYGMVEEAKAIL